MFSHLLISQTLQFILASVALASVWEQDVDAPTLRVNEPADSIHGLHSGETCPLGKELFQKFGGRHGANECGVALETPEKVGYYAYCDQEISYLVQIDMESCSLDELPMFRDQRLTGTVLHDDDRGQIAFSHLHGTYAFRIGTPEALAAFPDTAVFSKREVHVEEASVYLLNTLSPQPYVDRIDWRSLRHTRLGLGEVTVGDYGGGRLLANAPRPDGEVFGLYDLDRRGYVQRWHTPPAMRGKMTGTGWLTFWSVEEFVLVDASTGESMYRGEWESTRPPPIRRRGDAFYLGSTRVLSLDRARPISTSVRRISPGEAG